VAWYPETHICAADRVASRVELLDALREGRVLRVACQDCCLVQVLATVLNTLDLHTDLNSCLLKVAVSPDTHGFCRSNLAGGTHEVGRLLRHRDGLIYVSLHELILRVLRPAYLHVLAAPLA